MLTKTDNTVENLKNLWIEIFLDKTSKVSNVADGGVLNATAYGTAKIGQKAMKDIAIVEAQLFPDNGSGEFLDKSAALYGVSPRKGALGSSTYVRVYAEVGTVYDESFVFVNKNGIRFQVDVPLTVGPTGYGYVKVRSINAGYITNVPPNTITTISPKPVGHIECTNEYYAIGGRDSEDDETFRIRIKNNNNLKSNGTIEKLTQLLQNIDDRVLRVVNAGPDDDGMFNFYIVSQNGISFSDDELSVLLEKTRNEFNLTDIDIEGNSVGIRYKNIDWFYVGSERGIDFRVDIDPSYSIADVRKNIQVALTKYLDFRFWTPGKTVQWDDLLEIVKRAEGVKFVPDEFFFPYYDEQVPINQLPRVRGFVMRNSEGIVLFDSANDLSPLFYTAEDEDVFKGLTDSSLNLTQAVYFVVKDDSGNLVPGFRISVGNNIVLTNENGEAVISVPNGEYSYTATKDKYDTATGSFVVLNAPVFIDIVTSPAPYTLFVKIDDESRNPVSGVLVTAEEKETSTDINGNASLKLKNGLHNLTIEKLGYVTVNQTILINDEDLSINITIRLRAWTTVIKVLDETNIPIQGVLVSVGENQALTDNRGEVQIGLKNGNYNVTLKKIGYNTVYETIVVQNQQISVSYKMSLFDFEVGVVVTGADSRLPLNNILVQVNDGVWQALTNNQGGVQFLLKNGEYILKISDYNYDEIEYNFNVSNANLDIPIELEFRHFETTILVVDTNQVAIPGATIVVDGETLTTNDEGQVIARLQNGTYSYSVTKIGYITRTDTVVVNGEGSSRVTTMESQPFDITFVVTGPSGNVSAANLFINGTNYTTNAQGRVVVSLINGSYNYSVSKVGYITKIDELTVFNGVATETVTLELTKYAVTFLVTGRSIPLQGVNVTVGGQTVQTNAGGVATFQLSGGTYSYVMMKEDYVQEEGSVVVNFENTNKNVELTPNNYNLKVVVRDKASSPALVSGVLVNLTGQGFALQQTTNAQGEVDFSVWSGSYIVNLSKTGYISKESEITLIGAKTEQIQIDKISTLSFDVISSDGPVEDVVVTLTGSAIQEGSSQVTTNAQGKTPNIQVVNGQYDYTAVKTGYSPVIGSGTINNANKTEQVELSFGFEIKFILKDKATNNVIPNAEILVDSTESIITSTNGEASIYLSTGTHTYKVDEEGWLSTSGNVVVETMSKTVNIETESGGGIEFHVTDNTTTNVQNAKIEIYGIPEE